MNTIDAFPQEIVMLHEFISVNPDDIQLVRECGDVCQAITELAVERSAPLGTEDIRTLHRGLDTAVAGAIARYRHERHQVDIDRKTEQAGEGLGFFAHELRNLINTAILAFDVLKMEDVRIAGTAGSVLHRSLAGLRVLADRSLAEVRLARGVLKHEPFLVSSFIDEVAPAATLEAHARRVTLTVLPVEDGVTINADRHVLAAVVGNLLQNAFKFTRPQTAVTLRVTATTNRVLMDVEDECGGLPGGHGQALFRAFEQRGADRSGLGLGLAFSQWGAEANNGRLHTRNVPERGCVFTLDLPRASVATLASPNRL